MKRTWTLTKLALALLLATGALSLTPTPATAQLGGFRTWCVMACINPPFGCSSVSCKCDALGGAWASCYECSDNDYHCFYI